MAKVGKQAGGGRNRHGQVRRGGRWVSRQVGLVVQTQVVNGGSQAHMKPKGHCVKDARCLPCYWGSEAKNLN